MGSMKNIIPKDKQDILKVLSGRDTMAILKEILSSSMASIAGPTESYSVGWQAVYCRKKQWLTVRNLLSSQS